MDSTSFALTRSRTLDLIVAEHQSCSLSQIEASKAWADAERKHVSLSAEQTHINSSSNNAQALSSGEGQRLKTFLFTKSYPDVILWTQTLHTINFS